MRYSSLDARIFRSSRSSLRSHRARALDVGPSTSSRGLDTALNSRDSSPATGGVPRLRPGAGTALGRRVLGKVNLVWDKSFRCHESGRLHQGAGPTSSVSDARRGGETLLTA